MYSHPFHSANLTKLSFLITGGAGFIGSNLVEYLLKYGAGKVRVLDNLSNGFKRNVDPFLSDSRYEFIEGDISNVDTCMKACERIDIVSHQAALGSVPRSIQTPLATHAANATGFLNMLEAARKTKVQRFIFASSSSVYGDATISPKKEENLGNLLSPYAVSKLTNELYARVFVLNYGMKVIGLRYFNVFGPRQDPNGPYAAAIPLFMNAMLKGTQAKIFGDGNQTRDFTFVENAVQANIKAFFAENEKAFGKIFNVAVGETTSVNDLFQTLNKISGKNIKPEYVPERKGDIKNSLADISLAKNLLSYQPQVKMEEGLKITFEWFSSTFG